MMSGPTTSAPGIVALFNASDDTIDMVQKLLTASGREQVLIWCHFADLKKGIVNFEKYMEKHNPEVVIFDLSPPYDENWRFFKTMRDAKTMRGRGMVLTTTNKNRLDEVLGEDSHALEVVGRTKDLQEIDYAIKAETIKAVAMRLTAAG
jgi:predicted unusual protein kinase regulating ubiquinone biosynthesis (AarF/ABC1/UbiB family)